MNKDGPPCPGCGWITRLCRCPKSFEFVPPPPPSEEILAVREAFDKTMNALRDAPLVRLFCHGDPPPAAPPVPGMVWNKVEQYWQESDDDLRARVKQAYGIDE